jgi:creatinine amidohydrolase
MPLASNPVPTFRRALVAVALLGPLAAISGQAPTRPPASAPSSRAAEPVVTGVRLADLTWPAAEQRLKPDAVVVLPLGAAAQEHGLHLELDNDRTLADYFTTRLLQLSDIVAAPALPYHYFPAFAEYPGSTSVSLNTARDLTADVVRSVARHGPRRFYVLNAGHSSTQALAAAATALASEGILLHYTNWRGHMDATRGMQQQAGGNHADEIETSMMLYIDPSAVTMSRAQRDFTPAAGTTFQLTRQVGGRGTYSPTGAWGDPSLATREKGRVVVEAMVVAIRNDIEALRKAPLPTPAPSSASSASSANARGPGASQPERAAGDCAQGDDRTIRAIGPRFQLAWANQDVDTIVSLWAAGGDMAHPDGLVESTARIIGENRAYLFRQREYRNSKHFLGFGTIRCITPDVAIADAKWELRGVTDAGGQIIPPAEGLCTLVLMRQQGRWLIEAWRYNMKPEVAAKQPLTLPKPGFLPRVR